MTNEYEPKREIRAEAAELMADEVAATLVMYDVLRSMDSDDPWNNTTDVLKDWCHDWAAKFRDGAK